MSLIGRLRTENRRLYNGTGWYIEAEGNVAILTFDGWDGTSFYVPNEWQPSTQSRSVASNQVNGETVRIRLTTNGNVSQFNATTSALNIYGEITYFI